MEPKTARRFVISGRVQGVGFRAFAQHAARAIGVTGWAQNLDNGDVEVHANGTPRNSTTSKRVCAKARAGAKCAR